MACKDKICLSEVEHHKHMEELEYKIYLLKKQNNFKGIIRFVPKELLH